MSLESQVIYYYVGTETDVNDYQSPVGRDREIYSRKPLQQPNRRRTAFTTEKACPLKNLLIFIIT